MRKANFEIHPTTWTKTSQVFIYNFSQILRSGWVSPSTWCYFFPTQMSLYRGLILHWFHRSAKMGIPEIKRISMDLFWRYTLQVAEKFPNYLRQHEDFGRSLLGGGWNLRNAYCMCPTVWSRSPSMELLVECHAGSLLFFPGLIIDKEKEKLYIVTIAHILFRTRLQSYHQLLNWMNHHTSLIFKKESMKHHISTVIQKKGINESSYCWWKKFCTSWGW